MDRELVSGQLLAKLSGEAVGAISHSSRFDKWRDTARLRIVPTIGITDDERVIVVSDGEEVAIGRWWRGSMHTRDDYWLHVVVLSRHDFPFLKLVDQARDIRL